MKVARRNNRRATNCHRERTATSRESNDLNRRSPPYPITQLPSSVRITVETRQFAVLLFVKELLKGPHTLRRGHSIRLSCARINSESGHVLDKRTALEVCIFFVAFLRGLSDTAKHDSSPKGERV
jgi:hypothetical protein